MIFINLIWHNFCKNFTTANCQIYAMDLFQQTSCRFLSN